MERLIEIVKRETESKEFRCFALLPERDLLSTDIKTKDLIKLIEKYNSLIYDAKSKHINETFEW